jgi:hypothetical protein
VSRTASCAGAGLERARAQGKTLGRKRIDARKEASPWPLVRVPVSWKLLRAPIRRAQQVIRPRANIAITELSSKGSVEPNIPYQRLTANQYGSIALVTGSCFIILTVLTWLYIVLGQTIGISSKYPEMLPTKIQIIRFSILLTLAFVIVMTIAVKMKRMWRARSKTIRSNESIKVAIVSYFCTVWINVAINYLFNGNILNPLSYIFAINQGVLGYFVARYIDRALSESGVSVRMSLLQGAIQGVVAGIAASFAATPAVLSVWFSVVQWFMSGTLCGIIFQYVYGKAVSSERAEVQKDLRGAESTQ